jgi:hypothetical protein
VDAKMTSQRRVSDLWDKFYTLTWSTEGTTPLELLSKGAAILLVAVFLGLFYPGVIAYATGMFFKTDVESTLDRLASSPEADNCKSHELRE